MKKSTNMKRWWSIVLIAAMVFTLAACSRENSDQSDKETEQAEEVEEIVTDIYPPTFQTFSTGDGYAVVYKNTVLLKSDTSIRVIDNGNGSAAACMTREGLYLANAAGATQITEEEAYYYNNVRIARDGAAMTYVVDDVLYYYSMEAEELVQVAEQVRWHALSALGSYVVYLTQEGLFRWNGEGQLLDETMTRGSDRVCLVGEGGVLYVDEEETLWFAPKDGEPDKVDKHVKSVWQDGSCFYYCCGEADELQDVYFSRDGENFSLIEGIYNEPKTEGT